MLRPTQKAMSWNEHEHIFRLAMMVVRQLPEDQRENFTGAVNMARSGMISMDTLMSILDEVEGVQPSQSQSSSCADVSRGKAPPPPPSFPRPRAQPAALRPGLAPQPQAATLPCGQGPQEASTFEGWPDMQTVPLTWENVEAFLGGKGGGTRKGKRGRKGEGKGKGKKGKQLRARNFEAARRNLNQFLERHPEFVFQPREDIPKTMQQLWSQLEEDRDNLPRALQKHFLEAPGVLENTIAEMVINTHWPVDKNNAVEKESKAKREANGDCNTYISKMSNLSSRTTRRY